MMRPDITVPITEILGTSPDAVHVRVAATGKTMWVARKESAPWPGALRVTRPMYRIMQRAGVVGENKGKEN